ncbi:HalOD1 output domain-containing protein [Halobacterium wangiae]|uniref:HalOD1 output domain-containing protein n=1 Tax=Halobacterium wangiae TaxID=2902623 RepID=UPI001E471E36|nr:HalOD1 output domain-containing protein [Halobacterium wangiae]
MTGPGLVGPSRRAGERASEAVVEAVANRSNTEQTSLPPLYGVVEPDSLDTLAARADESDILVSFEYAGYDVRVAGPMDVTVSAIDD